MAKPPANSIYPKTLAEWRAWLAVNHTQMRGVWLISDQKETGKPRLEDEEAIDEAVCFGWVDTTVNVLDEERSMRWFSPRGRRSPWSRSNQRRVARLTAEGRMMPAGLAKVELAKIDGSWTRLGGVEELEIPPDLGKALDQFADARQRFEASDVLICGILMWSRVWVFGCPGD